MCHPRRVLAHAEAQRRWACTAGWGQDEKKPASERRLFVVGSRGFVATAAKAAVAIANIRALVGVVTRGAVATGGAGGFTGAGEVDHDRASIHGHAVQCADGRLGHFSIGHFHESKSFGAAGFAVHHDLGGRHAAELGEVAFEGGVGHGVGQVAHVDFAAHGRAFLRCGAHEKRTVGRQLRAPAGLATEGVEG